MTTKESGHPGFVMVKDNLMAMTEGGLRTFLGIHPVKRGGLPDSYGLLPICATCKHGQKWPAVRTFWTCEWIEPRERTPGQCIVVEGELVDEHGTCEHWEGRE